MAEPDVTITDFLLGCECLIFVYLIITKSKPSDFRRYVLIFFTSIAFAAIAGGLAHGFFPDESSRGRQLVWCMTMFAMGGMGFSSWLIAANLQTQESVKRVLTTLGKVGIIIYILMLTLVSQAFVIAIAYYLPAALLLLISLFVRYKNTREKSLRPGIGGLLLTFVASYIQQAQIGLDPVYFNHNALYHLVEFIALLLIFVTLRELVVVAGGGRPARPSGAPRAEA